MWGIKFFFFLDFWVSIQAGHGEWNLLIKFYTFKHLQYSPPYTKITAAGVSDGVHNPSVPRRVPPQLPHQLPGGLRRAPTRRQRQEHRHLTHRQTRTVCYKVN